MWKEESHSGKQEGSGRRSREACCSWRNSSYGKTAAELSLAINKLSLHTDALNKLSTIMCTRRLIVVVAVSLLQLVSSSLPEISFNDLKSAVDGSSGGGHLPPPPSLLDRGGKLSAFVVKDVSPAYADAVARLKDLAPDCIGGNEAYPISSLSDGSTRRTFATEDDVDFPECLWTEMGVLSASFGQVETLVARLVELVVGKRLRYSDEAEQEGEFVGAPHKDHIHVYARDDDDGGDGGVHHHGGHGRRRRRRRSGDSTETEEYLVPFHVDNGLFLLLTPFQDHGLQLRLSDGTIEKTDRVNSSSVLVLFGQGLTHWLLQAEEKTVQEAFFAVPHAVPSMAGGSLKYRSVYARMKVVPANARPVVEENHLKTQEELVRFQEVFSGKWQDSQVCSVDLQTESRDNWLKAMDSNCAVGEAYCWMGCYPLPESCPAVESARCFSKVTNVTCSTEVGGKPMDATCKWECKPPSAAKRAEYEASDYCNGKMGMLMLGFETAGDKKNPCIVLFVEAWTLDSRLKFAVGCVGVLVLGFCIEALIAFRRVLTRRKRTFLNMTGGARKALLLSCFGLNLVLGYLAMLVAMTYSVELFLFVVAGLVIGHAVFNMNSAVGETIDPCCASSQNDPSRRKAAVGSSRYEDEPSPQASTRDVEVLLLEHSNGGAGDFIAVTPASPVVSNGNSCCRDEGRKRPGENDSNCCDSTIPRSVILEVEA